MINICTKSRRGAPSNADCGNSNENERRWGRATHDSRVSTATSHTCTRPSDLCSNRCLASSQRCARGHDQEFDLLCRGRHMREVSPPLPTLEELHVARFHCHSCEQTSSPSCSIPNRVMLMPLPSSAYHHEGNQHRNHQRKRQARAKGGASDVIQRHGPNACYLQQDSQGLPLANHAAPGGADQLATLAPTPPASDATATCHGDCVWASVSLAAQSPSSWVEDDQKVQDREEDNAKTRMYN